MMDLNELAGSQERPQEKAVHHIPDGGMLGSFLEQKQSVSPDLISRYDAFLRAKLQFAQSTGFDVAQGDVNPLTLPHQADVIRWAARGGRRAIFAAFGLGKSLMQVELARLMQKHVRGRYLQVCPLGVRQEFIRDGHLDTDDFRRRADALGLDYDRIRAEYSIDFQFVKKSEQVGGDGFYLTNYESVRDRKIDMSLFSGVNLDEASILRGFGGTKTFREFMRLFEGTSTYRFVATATPSPNEYIELLAYAAFLDIMDVGQAKTRFFKRNSEKADQLTIHPHKTREFWLWVSSWAIFLQKPSDLCGCICHSDQDTAAKEHGHSQSGKGCSTDAGAQLIKTGTTMEGEGSESANDGMSSSTSSATWDSLPLDQHLSASITTETTSLETANGRVENPKQGTHGDHLSSPTKGEASPLRRGPKSSDVTTGSSTPESRNSDGHQIEHSKGWCDSCRCDEGYQLPELDVHWHEIPSIHSNAGVESSGQGRLLKNAAIGVVDAAREKRDSLSARIEKMMEIRAIDPDAHRLIWHDLEAEREAIENALDSDSWATVWGSQDLDDREKLIQEFSDGEIQELATKPVIAGSGCNFQRHCSWEIFLGIGFKFNDFIQAIHRCHRFLQKKRVRIDLIYTEAEREVRRQLERKWEQHKVLTAEMTKIIREYGLATNALEAEMARTLGVQREQVQTDNATLAHNDTVLETARMDDNSVELILTSIPFSTQYEYSPSYNDFGHTDSNEHFWAQMDFLIPNLFRVLSPGRVAAIHVKDRIVPGGMTGLGFQTVYPFSDDCIQRFVKHGFGFLARKTIVTDVVRENNQTYRLGWTEQCKDGSRMGAGMPEYLLLFRKPPTDTSDGYADLPVVKEKAKYTRSRWQIDAHGYMRSSGERLLSAEDLTGIKHDTIFKLFRKHSLSQVYDYEHHVALSESLERCSGCGHIHTGMRKCGHVEQEEIECPTCEGSMSVEVTDPDDPTVTAGAPCPDCLDHQGWVYRPVECECPKSGGILPVTFMLLQPQSWHPDVWSDITRMRTLNAAQHSAGKEMHLCPLQFDIVDRVITQFSMEGETVFDPFMGIGTVPLCAVKHGRKGYGTELAAGYFQDAVNYVQEAERKASVPTLFDLIERETTA